MVGRKGQPYVTSDGHAVAEPEAQAGAFAYEGVACRGGEEEPALMKNVEKTADLGACDKTTSWRPKHSWAIVSDPNNSVRKCYMCGVLVEGHWNFQGFFVADRVLKAG